MHIYLVYETVICVLPEMLAYVQTTLTTTEALFVTLSTVDVSGRSASGNKRRRGGEHLAFSTV